MQEEGSGGGDAEDSSGRSAMRVREKVEVEAQPVPTRFRDWEGEFGDGSEDPGSAKQRECRRREG